MNARLFLSASLLVAFVAVVSSAPPTVPNGYVFYSESTDCNQDGANYVGLDTTSCPFGVCRVYYYMIKFNTSFDYRFYFNISSVSLFLQRSSQGANGEVRLQFVTLNAKDKVTSYIGEYTATVNLPLNPGMVKVDIPPTKIQTLVTGQSYGIIVSAKGNSNTFSFAWPYCSTGSGDALAANNFTFNGIKTQSYPCPQSGGDTCDPSPTWDFKNFNNGKVGNHYYLWSLGGFLYQWFFTTGVTTGITSGVTTGAFTTGEFTTGEFTTGETTGITTGETTGVTTGITTGVTTGITTGEFTTGPVTTGETTGITTGETTGVTSGITTGETTGITTGVTTGITTSQKQLTYPKRKVLDGQAAQCFYPLNDKVECIDMSLLFNQYQDDNTFMGFCSIKECRHLNDNDCYDVPNTGLCRFNQHNHKACIVNNACPEGLPGGWATCVRKYSIMYETKDQLGKIVPADVVVAFNANSIDKKIAECNH